MVETTVRSGCAFHILSAARGEVPGRFDAGATRHVTAPVVILNGR
ncbi:hypothetical protein [Streptomyces sp. NPDC056730]